MLASSYFYPRPPYGGRPCQPAQASGAETFLSTSPVWGTTGDRAYYQSQLRFLSTSPVWGTTQGETGPQGPQGISIHVPRMGDDLSILDCCGISALFLSTSPVWGTTDIGRAAGQLRHISIHVPRMGDDSSFCCWCFWQTYFYPRPPYGGRLAPIPCILPAVRFLSTSPVWGTTSPAGRLRCQPRDFYPRPPYGGRRVYLIWNQTTTIFLSTSPVWGTTN